MKSAIPNGLTLANLACGLLAITALFSGSFIMAAWLVGAALVLDFLDGFTARLLGVHSELGKQLDSLADLVTFGVTPGFLMFKLFRIAMQGGEPIPEFLPYIALLIPIFSALRLAKFNIDTRQAEYFIGLPTPANAIFIFSVALIALYGSSSTMEAILLHPFFLTITTVSTSFLLVAELPLMSLKVKNTSLSDNRGRIVLLVLIALLLLVFRFRALLYIIPLYLVLSLIFKPHRK